MPYTDSSTLQFSFQITCQTNNNSHIQDNVTLVVNRVHLKDQQLVYIYVQNIDLI